MEITLMACRANVKMSQSELAAALNVSPGTVYNWEKGNTEPTLTQLRKISEITGVPIDNIAVGQLNLNCNS